LPGNDYIEDNDSDATVDAQSQAPGPTKGKDTPSSDEQGITDSDASVDAELEPPDLLVDIVSATRSRMANAPSPLKQGSKRVSDSETSSSSGKRQLLSPKKPALVTTRQLRPRDQDNRIDGGCPSAVVKRRANERRNGVNEYGQ
jgi:hypothetical protein